MRLELPYGAGTLRANFTRGRRLGVLDVGAVPPLDNVAEQARQALDSPIGLARTIFEIVRPGERVTIIVSDSFRETGMDLVLPALINGLNDVGVPDDDVTFLVATGTHRGPTPEESAHILGREIYGRFAGRVITHDPHDAASMVYVGTTSRGTPVEVNKVAHECDRVIATGAVVLHYFGGFGGGRKSLLPGVTSVKTIAHNHAMNLDAEVDELDPDVRIGVMDGNPVAEDMLEGARMMKCDYIINTVLNGEGRVAKIFAGELEAAHRAAADYAHDLFTVRIDEKADLVIASSGSTRNFVQTHKALYNAYQAVKPEGRIILVAECPEGLGGEQFVKWLRLGSPSAIIAGLRKQSEINGQTALSTLHKGRITTMVTSLSDADVSRLGATKSMGLQEALDELEGQFSQEPTFYLMPTAAYTVPLERTGRGP